MSTVHFCNFSKYDQGFNPLATGANQQSFFIVKNRIRGLIKLIAKVCEVSQIHLEEETKGGRWNDYPTTVNVYHS